MKAPIINTERLDLIPLDRSFCSQQYVNWMNDSDVIRYMESGGDYTLQKLDHYLEEVEKKDMLFWAIKIRDIEKHIGNIKIDPINYKHGFGEYGIMLGEKAEWGRDFAHEASSAVMEHVFKQFNLRKVTLGVVEENETAIKAYQKIGFETEGVLKAHWIQGSRALDIRKMAIFNPNSISG